jgi:predicted CopG family antitoxin
METTTIAVTKEIRDQINEFGHRGETFSDILARLLESARKRMLHDLLMNTEDCISLDELAAEVEKKWPKSK